LLDFKGEQESEYWLIILKQINSFH